MFSCAICEIFKNSYFEEISANNCFYTLIITLIIIFTFITFTTISSSLSQMFYKIGVLKRRLQQRRFSVKFAKFLRTSFLTEHLHWLLLYHCKLHLYRLRILTIPLDCNIIPGLFGLNFVIFLPVYIFL